MLDLIQPLRDAKAADRPSDGTTPDFRWPDQRLMLEADGRDGTATSSRADDDRAPGASRGSGRRVLRVTWSAGGRRTATRRSRGQARGRREMPRGDATPRRGSRSRAIIRSTSATREAARDQALLGVLERLRARGSSPVARHTSTGWSEIP